MNLKPKFVKTWFSHYGQFWFSKYAILRYSPLHYRLVMTLGHLIDGVTGLIALPFGRYGTTIYTDMCEATLRYSMKKRKEERGIK